MNVVAKPNLFRKRQSVVVPKATVQAKPQIVVKNSSNQVVRRPQQSVANSRSSSQSLVVKRQPKIDLNNASRKQLILKKVKHVTPDISSDDQSKIRNLSGLGVGRVLVILGNGPSLAEVNTSVLRDVDKLDLMSINKPDMRVWPTKYWTFFDPSQYRRHQELWDDYSGIIFNSSSIKNRKSSSFILKNIGGSGFSLDLVRGFHIGRSSTYAAMQIGLWLGYEHIFILGLDMDVVGDKSHFYGVNLDVPCDKRKKRFAAEAVFYEEAANSLPADIRSRFTICSDYMKFPFADKFNKVSHVGCDDLILSFVLGL